MFCYQSVPNDALLASLARCNKLTDLTLKCAFSSAHLSALFAKLTIKNLTIRGGGIKTLQCFVAGPITQSLEELTLESLALPPSELHHLYGLRRLRTLHLDGYSTRLDDTTLDSLSPPTSLLPALTEMRENWLSAYGDRNSRVRQGPSFEWMQQRLTQ